MAGDWGDTLGVSGNCFSDSVMVGVDSGHCDMAMATVCHFAAVETGGM